MKLCITTPVKKDPSNHQLRKKISQRRTTVVEDYIYDRVTGECWGIYITAPYSPDPIQYTKGTPATLGKNWFIEDDGTITILNNCPPPSGHLAPVIELFPQKPMAGVKSSSTPGPKPQAIDNPLATALQTLRFEQRPTPWLDDIAFGAIYIGPGVINGQQSVSLADVKKVLRLPTLSTASAAGCLLNHDRQPMCTRQVQRVVEAARTALRGIALYLERHPEILLSVDVAVDFDKLWDVHEEQSESAVTKEHPMKQRAIEMISSQVPTKTIAKALKVSKNTVKKWDREVNSTG